MTWTYAGTPGEATADELRDAVRFRIGDTDETDKQITDEEIAYLLDQSGDSVAVASIQAIVSLISKYSRQADVRMGKTAIRAGQRASAYRSLLAQMRMEQTILASVFAGGLTKSGKDSMASDTDAVQPAFSVGQDDIMDQDSTNPDTEGS